MKTARPENRPFWRRALSSPLVLAVNLVLLGFVGFSVAREASGQRSAQGNLDELHRRISELEKKNSSYVTTLGRLGTSGFVEQEARLKLGYQKPGERVMVIRNENAASAAEPEKGAASGQALTNPQKWWRYFMGGR